MTLQEFLAYNKNLPISVEIEHEDFDRLYLRKWPKSYGFDNTIIIAHVVAKNPGNGSFGRLFERLVECGFNVYMENVHNQRFGNKLERIGFKRVAWDLGPNYLYRND